MEYLKSHVDSALLLLSSTQCQFKVIEPDGTTHGTLVATPLTEPVALAEPVKPCAAEKSRRRGDLKKYLVPYVQGTVVGEVRHLPLGPYASQEDSRGLRSSLCSYLRDTWGQGNSETSLDLEGQYIRFVRQSPEIRQATQAADAVRAAQFRESRATFPSQTPLL